MDLRHLITYVKVVECSSFTRAAEALGYTQSSITAHLQLLEADLGVSLLDRQGRTFKLTEAGRGIYEGAVEILRIIENLNETKYLNGPITGSLKIAAPESMMKDKLEPILTEFINTHQRVSLTISNYTCNAAYQKLVEGECDLALIFLPLYSDSRLDVKPISIEPLVMVASTKCDEMAFNEFVEKQVLKTPLIVNELDCIYRNMIEQYLIDHGIASSRKIEIWGVETIKRLVMDGVGISLLPENCVRTEIQSGQLKCIALRPSINPIKMYLVYLKDRPLTRVAQTFIEAVSRIEPLT